MSLKSEARRNQPPDPFPMLLILPCGDTLSSSVFTEPLCSPLWCDSCIVPLPSQACLIPSDEGFYLSVFFVLLVEE